MATELQVHTEGRRPTSEAIKAQRAEQLRALLIIRGICGYSRRPIPQPDRNQLNRLSEARGLPG